MEQTHKVDEVIHNPPERDFKAGDSAAKTWFLFAALWFPVFASFGFILAIKFFYPQFLGGQPGMNLGAFVLHTSTAFYSGLSLRVY